MSVAPRCVVQLLRFYTFCAPEHGMTNAWSVQQVSRRVLYVNVSASLPVDVAPGASDEDVRAAVSRSRLPVFVCVSESTRGTRH